MKNFILTMFFALMSCMMFAGNPDRVTNYNHNTQFTQIVVEAPCRVMYGVADSTAINIRNTNSYDIYYEVKDSILYIKTNEFLDNIIENSKYTDEIPLIRIFNKNVMPTIKTSSSLQICERTISTKKQALNNGTTTSLAKN